MDNPALAERRMHTWKGTELLRMLQVTAIGSHSRVLSQALDEVRHRLVNVFLWQLFPDGVQGSFQLISYLRLWLAFVVLFQHDPPDMTVRCASRVGSSPTSFNKPGTVPLQPLVHDARTLISGRLSWLKEHNFCHFQR